MNGVIILDKPEGFTSFDAVAVMRRVAGERKIGHTGTLDPMATGVLPLLLGRAAKAADLLPDTEKAYRASFRLGEKTDTGDRTGTVLQQDKTPVTEEALQTVLPQFQGDIWQIPPMYSAVSVGGKRLYQLARQGIEVQREKRPVTITRLELLSYQPDSREGELLVSCSKGTYIRTLIEDIAEAAGTLGVMTDLRRIRACGFSEEEAISLDKLRQMGEEGTLSSVVRPVESLFSMYPQVHVTKAQSTRFQNGGSLDISRLFFDNTCPEGQRVRVFAPGKVFLGLATRQGETLRFCKLFLEREEQP